MLIKESLEKIPNNPNEKRLGQYLIDQGILLENATVRTVAKEVFLAPSSVGNNMIDQCFLIIII